MGKESVLDMPILDLINHLINKKYIFFYHEDGECTVKNGDGDEYRVTMIGNRFAVGCDCPAMGMCKHMRVVNMTTSCPCGSVMVKYTKATIRGQRDFFKCMECEKIMGATEIYHERVKKLISNKQRSDHIDDGEMDKPIPFKPTT